MANLGGKGTQIEPTKIFTAKHMTKWLFTDMKMGKYRLILTQSAKPKDCFNLIDVKFTLSPSLNE